jgi:hypothetical protein
MLMLKTTKADNKKGWETIYSRVVSTTTSSRQIELLKAADKRFIYGSDFNEDFAINLCGKCNSKYQRLAYKKTTEPQQMSDATVNSINDELDDEKLERMDILLLVMPSDGMKYPSKHLTLNTMEFEEFRLQLVHEVRRIVENNRIRSEDLRFAYRSTKSGIGTALYDEMDYDKFLREYQRLSTKREITVTVTMKKVKTKKRHASQESSNTEVNCILCNKLN